MQRIGGAGDFYQTYRDSYSDPRDANADVEPADSVAPAVDSPMPAAEPVEAVEPTPQPPTVKELNQRLVAWEAGLLQDYRIVYQEIGSASREQSAPVIITVRNGSVASVVYRSNGQPAPLRSYPNVEQLFAVVEAALSGDYKVVQVAFDPELGYPTVVSLASNWPGEAEAGFTAKVLPDSPGRQTATYGASPEARQQ